MTSQGHKRGEIQLGDLITAFVALSCEEDSDRELIAQSLGFQHLPGQRNQGRSRSAHHSHSQKPDVSDNEKPTPKFNRPTAPRPPRVPVPLPEAASISSLSFQGMLESDEDDLQKPDMNFERYDDHKYTPLPLPSLLPNRTARGVLSALLQTQRTGRRLDLQRLIRESSTGYLPSSLPRLKEVSLQNGCQLLLDVGHSMSPWRDDLETLSAQVQDVVGAGQCTEFRYSDSPLEAEAWSLNDEPVQWQAIPGTPVLVVTDFNLPNGHNRYAIRKQWSRFIQQCKDSESPLLFLIPWDFNAELEETLGSYPFLFEWSEKSTASTVRSLIGPGHNVTS